MTISKALPTDKTAVFEFKLYVTDIVRRQRHLSEAFATKIPADTPFVSGDGVVSTTDSLDIENVSKLVVIYSFSPLSLTLHKGAEVITGLACNGLFCMSGNIDKIVVKGTVVGEPVRFLYAFA